MVRACDPSTWEAEAGGQPGLQSEFQDSQGYTEKLCLKNPKQNKRVSPRIRGVNLKVKGQF